MDYDAYDALLHHIFKQTQGDAWFKPSEENVHAGVCLRVSAGHFRVFPYENHYLESFEAAIRVINPVVAVKVRSAAVHAALSTVKEDADSIFVDGDNRIQILETMGWLQHADKEQGAAFIRDERVLVVWSLDVNHIIPTCQDFETKLIKLVWEGRPAFSSCTSSSASGSDRDEKSSLGLVVDDKEVAEIVDKKLESSRRQADDDGSSHKDRGCNWGLGYFRSKRRVDVERVHSTARPVRLLAALYSGVALGLAIYFVASGTAILLQELVLDGDARRFALLVTFPLLVCVSLFFCLQMFGTLSMMIGPVAQFHENSRYYSAIRPAPSIEVDSNLPHISIEMPVFRESLKKTIAPSVYSVKKAMQTYARQGGTSSIFVHDDGLRLISEQDQEERIQFYEDNNIGWVARPPHDNSPDGFKRAGRFKKASNMNYGLILSLKLEKHLARLEALAAERGEEIRDEDEIEDQALKRAIDESFEESGLRWRPWARNAKSLRLGEIILLVDSDTLVPEDCFRDAARELAESPEVAIIQHESDVMQVAHHYFENGIAQFTRRINKCISLSCANGEVAPFVGHNAFLRWAALQEAAFVDPADGVRKVWSERNVSEDFDMALRLILNHYSMRWATYSQGGFKEGVSLTCDDELSRWQKYAYGCNELIFNPLVQWWRKGPLNKQLTVFVWSSAPVHYKISMMAYMFSYYGIAISWVLSVLNYLMLGWSASVDGFYLHSWEIWLACIFVFTIAGNLGFSLLEYRLGHRALLSSLWENVSWIPFFFFFFGGLSIHLSHALLAHLLSYNIIWEATKKEVERSNFWLEIPKILKRFWLVLAVCGTLIVMMIILALPFVPPAWRISGYQYWAVIFPLSLSIGSHVLFPIVLNPWLMVFSY